MNMARQQSQTEEKISSRRLWILEILALIGTVLSLAVLVALLIAYDRKPIFDWNGVTLNAVVSVLSTISKTALLLAVAESTSQWKWILFSQQRRPLIDFENIDMASRGPWGSLTLLWTCKGAIFLRFGAITMVLSLAIDPFTQQLVQYEQRLVFSESGETTLAYVRRYSKGNEFSMKIALDPFLTTAPNTFADADFSMQSAILYGLTQPFESAVQQLPFHCSSGNCTWPSFRSLAVCSVCNDVSPLLEMEKSDGRLYAYLDTSNGAAHSEFDGGRLFRLPNGHFIDNFVGWPVSEEYDGKEPEYTEGTLATTFGTGNRSRTNTLQDMDTLVWAMSILRTFPDEDNTSRLWPDVILDAKECGLFYCVNDYASTVTNGTLSETETPVSDATRSMDSWKPFDTSFMSKPLDMSQLVSLEFDDKFSVLARSDLMLGDEFNVSQVAVDSISAYFQSQFKTEDHFFNESGYNFPGHLNGYYMIDGGAAQYRPSSIQALLSSDDMNETFRTIARSMSNALRADADGNTLQTNGESGIMITHYNIIWPWITLPCLVVVTGAMFLLITIYESRKGDIPIWKSSALATLSRGAYVSRMLGRADTLPALEKRAASESVQLFGPREEEMTRRASESNRGDETPDRFSVLPFPSGIAHGEFHQQHIWTPFA